MKKRAPRNRTLTCSPEEISELSQALLRLNAPVTRETLLDRVIWQDTLKIAPYIPQGIIDLLILDPPYNLSKDFHGNAFTAKDGAKYAAWFEQMLAALRPTLKHDATVYVCADWKTSNLIFPVLEKYFLVQNRITWEREKGRGAKTNWKNNTEDIWFCTMSNNYIFNVDAVKQKRRVIAPYRHADGTPKDWNEEEEGNFRLTYPSNIWTDITVPFWSMAENTDHPTQKPEKLIAKLMLASSAPGQLVFDPFLGSGTTAVVAKKLGRRFVGIEQNQEYCCWALKRLIHADTDSSIQGYADGVFWERNSLSDQPTENKTTTTHQPTLFHEV